MTILVLGGSGFIGPLVIRKLVERDQQVVSLDINPGAASFAEMGGQVEVLRGDVTQFEDVVKAVIEYRPERIINLAYLLGVGEGRPNFTMRLNVLGMDNCFEAVRLCGVKRVVYASPIAVSGPQKCFGDQPIDEDARAYGTSQYAVHKIFNEFQTKQYNQNYGMSITGIRPANVTGPDKVRGSTDHVQCITLPVREEPVSFPHKSLMRLPIYVEDIAEAFVRVLLVDSTQHPVYNSGGTPISLGALADLVGEFLPDAQITFDSEGGLEECGNYLVDNSRLMDEFELEYPPFRQLVLEIINEVRQDADLPTIGERR